MKKNIKRYRDLETGKIFTVDESKSVIIKFTPEEWNNEELREKKYMEAEKKFEELEKMFSDTEGEEEDDNTEEED